MVKMHAPDDETIERVNTTIYYAMWSVFAATGDIDAARADEIVADINKAVEGTGVTVRGYYDVSGMRADADLMVWWHAESVEACQAAYRILAHSELELTPVWSVAGLHRPAEFNKRHLPGFLLTDDAPAYMAVYPFVRSYDWYYMDPDKRAQILRDHGMVGRPYKDVVASTVSAFALGDYEFILAMECDELHRIVDLMRDFRNTEARLYVRKDTPFYTGPRVSLADWVSRQVNPHA
ncbi:MAG: chlorite dismutase family protein [Flaviflexus sp.]|nr:chlorite dismutase family protein [Flaviflexus sp.]